jgi:hypothetical protein
MARPARSPAGVVGLPFVMVSFVSAMFLSSGAGESEPPVAVAAFVGSLLLALAAFVVMVATSLLGRPRVAVPPWLRDEASSDDAASGNGTRPGQA